MGRVEGRIDMVRAVSRATGRIDMVLAVSTYNMRNPPGQEILVIQEDSIRCMRHKWCRIFGGVPPDEAVRSSQEDRKDKR